MTSLASQLALSRDIQSSPDLPVQTRKRSSSKRRKKKKISSESNSVVASNPPKKRKKKRTKRRKKKEEKKENEGKAETPEKEEKEINKLEQLKQTLRKSIRDFNARYEDIGKEIGVHNYEILNLLGVGAQGRVYLVRLIDTKQLYAMKVFLKESIIDNAKSVRSVLTEQRFLATTDHPFITKLCHSFQSDERLFMIMEYCPGGELWTLIKHQPRERLNEEQVRFYASEVLIVLEYIHSKGYIYRDLKPENILIHLDGHIRMADFGLSKQAEVLPEMKAVRRRSKLFIKAKSLVDFRQGGVIKTDSLVGSVHYLAPEVLSVGGSYDVMVDWWSFGILLYDMFYGGPPFQGRCNEEIIMKIVQGDYKFYEEIPISPELKSLIKGLLRADPKKRICAKRGANDLKKHPFFATIQWGLLRNVTPPLMPTIRHPEDICNFELYEDDEDVDEDFKFFSELPEDPNLLTPDEQKNFEEFQFTRKSFAQTIVGKLESPKRQTRVRSYSLQSCTETNETKKRKRRKKEREPDAPRRLSRSQSDMNPDEELYVMEHKAFFPTESVPIVSESAWPVLDDIPGFMDQDTLTNPSPLLDLRPYISERPETKEEPEELLNELLELTDGPAQRRHTTEIMPTNLARDLKFERDLMNNRQDSFSEKRAKRKPKRKSSASDLLVPINV